ATYLGIRTWVSTGPRGVQFKPDFRLSTVLATPEAERVAWSSFALGPGGHDVYAIRSTRGGRQQLMRIAGIDRGTRLHATQVLDYARLDRPGWHVGSGGTPAVASNGDVFLAVPAGAVRCLGGGGDRLHGAWNGHGNSLQHRAVLARSWSAPSTARPASSACIASPTATACKASSCSGRATSRALRRSRPVATGSRSPA